MRITANLAAKLDAASIGKPTAGADTFLALMQALSSGNNGQASTDQPGEKAEENLCDAVLKRKNAIEKSAAPSDKKSAPTGQRTDIDATSQNVTAIAPEIPLPIAHPDPNQAANVVYSMAPVTSDCAATQTDLRAITPSSAAQASSLSTDANSLTKTNLSTDAQSAMADSGVQAATNLASAPALQSTQHSSATVPVEFAAPKIHANAQAETPQKAIDKASSNVELAIDKPKFDLSRPDIHASLMEDVNKRDDRPEAGPVDPARSQSAPVSHVEDRAAKAPAMHFTDTGAPVSPVAPFTTQHGTVQSTNAVEAPGNPHAHFASANAASPALQQTSGTAADVVSFDSAIAELSGAPTPNPASANQAVAHEGGGALAENSRPAIASAPVLSGVLNVALRRGLKEQHALASTGALKTSPAKRDVAERSKAKEEASGEQQSSSRDSGERGTVHESRADVPYKHSVAKDENSISSSQPQHSPEDLVSYKDHLQSSKDQSAGDELRNPQAIADSAHTASSTLPIAQPLGSVQAARLVQKLSESELRVGLQAGEFGKIDIHTSLNQNQISAKIYVEHEDLGRVLAGTLPQLHEKLEVQHRLDAQVELYNANSDQADRHQNQQYKSATQDRSIHGDENATEPQDEALQSVSVASGTSGLDMHV